jgi:ribosomal-protein-alanine N-acetyltransferase
MTAPAADVAVLERMRWWDLEEIHALEVQVFADQPWSPAQLWSELARVPDSRCYVVARRAGVIIGYAGLFAVPPDGDLQTVAVARREQGRGVGALLLRSVVREARRRGVRLLHLEVRADNEVARRLYERAGFIVVGRRRDYYGRGHDAVLMTCRLPGGETDG